MHQLPDEYLADALPVAKKIALALGVENYNVLQVRLSFPAGRLTHTTPTLAEQREDRAPRGRPCAFPHHPQTNRW
jgi:hypothetical protein